MDSVSAANAASTTARAASTTSSTSTSKTSDGKDFATLFADAKRDLRKGETLSKVDGHDYARIKGGTRDDQCVNLSGNTRSGQAFDLIWRDGRQFHVYGGRGADHKVVEVGHKAASTTTTGGTDSTTASTGTTGTTSTDASASTGTASTTGTSSTGSNASDVTSSYTAGTTGTSDTSSSTR
ncbi:hypothetical protein [Conexibacter woesei]|uniref:hypothetical protein n=1 Tax=Conexibacter woesei TaxID=191495 RepID=UPI0004273686|nr:hypothetical protein [Conexibacter woesei]